MERLGDWDFFMTVFTEPDRLMTYAWDDFDARHPRHSSANLRLYGDMFIRHYEQLDAMVGRFVEEWQDKATIIIVSDHGFAGVPKFFYPNVLAATGRLPGAQRGRRGHRRWRGPSPWRAAWAWRTRQRSSPSASSPIGASPPGRAALIFVAAVDWPHTRAYWGADDGLTINLKGRQPQGSVEPADYEGLRDELIRRWSDLREPETGERVIEHVYRREEVYHGPYVQQSPDLRVVWKEYPARRMIYAAAGELWAAACWGFSGQTGDHAPVGILMATGRNVARGVVVEGAQIIDLAPTVLYALGQPVPADMDGRVLAGLFSDEFRSVHPIGERGAQGSAETPAPPLSQDAQPPAYSADEQKEIEDRLKALGYLD